MIERSGAGARASAAQVAAPGAGRQDIEQVTIEGRDGRTRGER